MQAAGARAFRAAYARHGCATCCNYAAGRYGRRSTDGLAGWLCGYVDFSLRPHHLFRRLRLVEVVTGFGDVDLVFELRRVGEDTNAVG